MLKYQLTVYCSGCYRDLAESDSDDLDTLAQTMETRAERVYEEHVHTSNCKG